MKTYSDEKLKKLESKNKLRWTQKGKPEYKQYLINLKGEPMNNLWNDIFHINPMAKERLGYPTQKPEALLERIITASSNKGDLVADFFCGCGTTVAVAERLKRNWLGVDISHLAIGLIEKRLFYSYGKQIKDTYEINGFPKDIASAKELAQGKGGRLKFQDWIIESKLGGVHNPKRTADGGWDGHVTFQMNKKKEVVLIEVKSGNVNVKNLREFIHVINSQEASIGVLVCFAEYVTKPMLLEAKNQGYYNQEFFGNRYDKIQLLTVEAILDEQEIQKPTTTKETFKQAQREINKSAKQNNLF
jgi:site-specific DNA-methyltransferase (adenine-specific)